MGMVQRSRILVTGIALVGFLTSVANCFALPVQMPEDMYSGALLMDATTQVSGSATTQMSSPVTTQATSPVTTRTSSRATVTTRRSSRTATRAGRHARTTPAAVFSDLGAAGPNNWAVLEVGTGSLTGQMQGIGNVGVQQNAAAAADRASTAASSLRPTSRLTQINLSQTSMSLRAGVYNLTNFQLDHSTLTLTGPGYFIFNITSAFTLNAAQILLAGGATEANILFNYKGTSDIVLSGATQGSPNESVLHGILLALNTNVTLAPGLFVGEIIGGKNISILFNPLGTAGPAPFPTIADTGSTLSLTCLALVALILIYFRASRHLIWQQTGNKS